MFGRKPTNEGEAAAPSSRDVLVDTSVLIDGRIIDIAKAGFMRSALLIPRFVLLELQTVADSDDPLKRARGRRGLEMLSTLQTATDVEVVIIDDDVPGIKEVDTKLVSVARKHGYDILTTDYNLNQVAQIEGVRVLNINELSNAIRPVVLPGETLNVKVVQPGKEPNQGVGYLPDGTMIVVENGDKLMNQEVATEVTRVFQTVAGKMIFVVPLSGSRKPIRRQPHPNRHNNRRPNQVSANQNRDRDRETDRESTPVPSKPNSPEAS